MKVNLTFEPDVCGGLLETGGRNPAPPERGILKRAALASSRVPQAVYGLVDGRINRFPDPEAFNAYRFHFVHPGMMGGRSHGLVPVPPLT